MPDRTCWFLLVKSEKKPEVFGLGEVAPLFGLSSESQEQVEVELNKLKVQIESSTASLSSDPNTIEEAFGLLAYSSALRFGIVMALLDLYYNGQKKYFDSPFFHGQPLSINGLVWMADAETMLKKAGEKIKQGFHCIKIKVGGLDFEEECRVLEAIRLEYSPQDLTLRLDANGAFSVADARKKLERLSIFQIHSIEQPLSPSDQIRYPEILRNAPIPIALDEQLIGRFSLPEKEALLATIRPSYLVLKPGLIGGFVETREWISTAQNHGIGWWITSALETPLGLNAIAQFTSLFNPELPQGLGTGQIFEDLFEHPLSVEGGHLSLKKSQKWGF
ncbi:MAG: o-succinylbenzoate synthase [Cyclobacteriaceae bacterium]|jgi:o-succinylbenzoate synthase